MSLIQHHLLNKRFFRSVFIAFLLGMFFSITSQANLVEGQDYKSLAPSKLSKHHEEVTVTEFFNLGCPHCTLLATQLVAWKAQLPNYVHFHPQPAVFKENEKWFKPYATLYYTLQALHISQDTALLPVFGACVQYPFAEEKLKPEGPKAMANFVNQVFDIKEQDFMKTFKSDSVDKKVRKAIRRTSELGIDSLPTMIVSGNGQQFMVTRAMAQQDGKFSPTKMLHTVNGLILKIHSQEEHSSE